MRGAIKRGVRGVRRLEGMVGEIAGARPGLEAPRRCSALGCRVWCLGFRVKEAEIEE